MIKHVPVMFDCLGPNCTMPLKKDLFESCWICNALALPSVFIALSAIKWGGWILPCFSRVDLINQHLSIFTGFPCIHTIEKSSSIAFEWCIVRYPSYHHD